MISQLWWPSGIGRGSADGSDIDFLVEVGERTSPWFQVGLVEELEQLLGRFVDVVTRTPFIGC